MDKHLLNILVDPISKGPLVYDKKAQELLWATHLECTRKALRTRKEQTS